MCAHYKLPKSPKILDVGCGKGYLLYDFKKVIPNAEIYGLDISKYALEKSKEEIKHNLTFGSALICLGQIILLILLFQLIRFIVFIYQI